MVFGISRDELDASHDHVGETVACPNCGGAHKIEYGKRIVDGKDIKSTMLGFVTCPKNKVAYIVTICGKVLPYGKK